MKTIAQLLQWAVKQLTDSESPKLDADVILCFLLDKDRSHLFTWDDKVMDDDIIRRFTALIMRRQAGEPVAHILGYREFWSLELEVSPDTLIPRPDTEVLVEQALACMPIQACQVLDLGTGTGAIALALASESPQATVTAIEYQQGAAALARRNAKRCGLDVAILQGSWFEPLQASQRFDVIVSNPPYIEEHDPHLAMGDVRFEPLTALVAADDGLADLKHIIREGYQFLTMDGWLLVEHGFEQGVAVRALFTESNYHQVVTHKDYGNNDRITVGQRKEA
ncbi:Peptide release factor-glutamine N5-methyltransferase [Moritella viscosa]|uniref:Release factor glutamine methyltransferase n=1 Tax=Moritella viscosa TaxID=80854 RepID=A0A090IGL9_9GAMM|nr:peptide chain release factor N(5)-glutamine methyltransferase [Moritella viscosa]CED61770.1 protein methyltransferase HemK [Moritella viscosa]SGY99624.1 Peptide release factor-glutamine N5-methyltransferase [Moritella viscosa]SHO05899.1 Peptide release factor-glutamine N5-methyltransferase [Moritella viscosa]SHO05900.1 Peptide release factor-glutamine N5-methyltransferase [Moritella viscosa]SHO06770.1 Peptide release factor-glutamine N5-methyltransferase [Moritella viscosa]